MRSSAWIGTFAAFAIASGCEPRAAAVQPEGAAETRQLQVGQSAKLSSGALEIAFDAVEGDSRCPKGEACISEGDAIVVLTVTASGKPPGSLALHAASKGPAVATHEGWRIRLMSLAPYPVAGRAIDKTEYVATLSVTRDAAPPAP